MKNKGTHFLVPGAAIAAAYVVPTPVFAPLSFAEVRIRLSRRRLCLFFTPAAIPTVRGMYHRQSSWRCDSG